MQRFTLMTIVLAISFLVYPLDVAGQIPRTLSYQGILSDTSGTPKPDGVYGMTFRLYTVPQGGGPLWSETKALATKRGLFNAVLGDVTPFPDSLRFNRRYWLSIQVSPDPELTPRIQLTAVGYSLNAAKADTALYARTAPGSAIADSARIAGTVPNNSITSAKIAPGQVVKSLNGMRDGITLRGQGAATVTSNGDTITITTPPPSGGTGVQSLQNTNNSLDILNPTGPNVTANVKVPLSLSASVSSQSAVFSATNTIATGLLHGIIGRTSSTTQNATGVYGEGLANSGLTSGVQGWATSSPLGTGVVGIGTANGGYFRSESGTGNGIIGTSANSIGVYGESNTNFGVLGRATGGTGVYGEGGSHGGSFSGSSFGVYGLSSSGTGIFGQGGTHGGSFFGSDFGVYGSGANTVGVYGISNSGVGLVGTSTNGDGIEGHSTGVNKSGVWGHNDRSDGVGVSGSSIGGKGVSGTSTNGDGVVGATNAANKSGVWGRNDAFGGVGVSGSSTNSIGVRGTTSFADAYAVYGSNTANQAFGGIGTQRVYGGILRPIGVYGAAANASGPYGIGVYGVAVPNQFNETHAGFFEGRVRVTGDFSVGGDKNFMIDHPSDPANKYLVHSCVESNDRMNIYNGNIITDASGNATVELPGYFAALNVDYRYQLTVIGQFAQAIISSKINNNRFSIKTDKPNIEVSWQVTGVRNDAYAKAHPMQVEVEKPAHEKGTYTHPELYGLPPRTSDLKLEDTKESPKESEANK
ncbi:MAG TPA: hypothetical protein VFG32_06110 [Bacteroidota bacterium]|nr:hypothetical protein [Bacteroidota bacterium]